MLTYVIDIRAGFVATIATLFYFAILVGGYLKFRPNIMKRFVDFGAEYSQVQRQMLHEMEIPYGLMEENGKVLWTNAELDNLVQNKNIRNKNILSIFEEFKPEYLEFSEDKRNEFRIEYEDHVYKIVLKVFELNDAIHDSQLAVVEGEDARLISMYMFDETVIQQLTKE